MISPRPENNYSQDEVDQLLLNARLRDELEPYLDESMRLVDAKEMPTSVENEFLASMLAWERAPALPIAEWFDPPLGLPPVDQLTAGELQEVLFGTVHRLFEKRIVLDFTEHLSDTELYRLIVRDILPSPEKKLDRSPTYLHWHCLDATADPDIWLMYYATAEERQAWHDETQSLLPPLRPLPYPRRLPRPQP
ncbi:MAG: hypothetical protein R3E01_13080 [Pirellulaceae bacterium]|nr:hypothetical protein [Planctomycetales bacterium]